MILPSRGVLSSALVQACAPRRAWLAPNFRLLLHLFGSQAPPACKCWSSMRSAVPISLLGSGMLVPRHGSALRPAHLRLHWAAAGVLSIDSIEYRMHLVAQIIDLRLHAQLASHQHVIHLAHSVT